MWRIIAARTAPWAKPRPLTKKDAPLLEYAVDFEAGVVKGPAPLACRSARFSSGVTYRDELFAGRLAGNDSAAKALSLSQPSTYRVFCGAAARDYYIDDQADMVMAEGDVIYTLERPTGMDPEQYKAGFSGPSIDCAKAKTTAEQLICGDAALSASDKQLGTVWRQLKSSLSGESFATFQSAERTWIAYATQILRRRYSDARREGGRAPIADCLNTEYGDRVHLLESAKVQKSGALLLEPRMRFRTRAGPATEESDIYPLMSGALRRLRSMRIFQKRCNSTAGGWTTRLCSAMATKFRTCSCTHSGSMPSSVSMAASSVLPIDTSDFVGGHGEEYGGFAINWDLAKSRPLSFDDMFVRGSDWKRIATKMCLDDLRRQTERDDKPADLDISGVAKQISDVGNWIWRKNKATVRFHGVHEFRNAGRGIFRGHPVHGAQAFHEARRAGAVKRRRPIPSAPRRSFLPQPVARARRSCAAEGRC